MRLQLEPLHLLLQLLIDLFREIRQILMLRSMRKSVEYSLVQRGMIESNLKIDGRAASTNSGCTGTKKFDFDKLRAEQRKMTQEYLRGLNGPLNAAIWLVSLFKSCCRNKIDV